MRALTVARIQRRRGSGDGARTTAGPGAFWWTGWTGSRIIDQHTGPFTSTPGGPAAGAASVLHADSWRGWSFSHFSVRQALTELHIPLSFPMSSTRGERETG